MVLGGTTYLLVDANVLIDYAKAERSILALAAKYLGQVEVLSPILAEVEQLDEDECERLGLHVVEPALAQVAAAAKLHGPLSFEDHLCLIVAKEHGWTCVTNDGALRQALQREQLPVMWGLELMIELVRAGQLEPADALVVAETMHTTNKLHISRALVNRFTERIREVTPVSGEE